MWRRIAPADPDATARGPLPLLPAVVLRSTMATAILALPLSAWLLRQHGAPGLGNALSVALVAGALVALTRGFGVRVTAALAIAALALIAGAAAAGLPPVYWPPVAMNLLMAGVFGISLRHGEPLVTRFARMERATLTPAIERYGRRLTFVWTAYLAVLGAIGIGIAIRGDERIGMWWCSGVNYLLIVALFVGERLVRRVDVPVGLFNQARNVIAVLRSLGD
jgi:uncharacterized membrane protein